LLYIAAYLEALSRYTAAFEEKIRQARTFLPLWVGAQRGVFSWVIVVVSFLAAPAALYFIFSRFSENTLLTGGLIALSSLLAALTCGLSGGCRRDFPALVRPRLQQPVAPLNL
jgi:hypothetical protein